MRTHAWDRTRSRANSPAPCLRATLLSRLRALTRRLGPSLPSGHKNHEANYAGGYFPPYAGGPFYVLSRPGVRFVLENSRRLNSKWRNEDMAVGTWFTGADVKIVQEWKIKLLNWKHHEKVRRRAFVRARARARGGAA